MTTKHAAELLTELVKLVDSALVVSAKFGNSEDEDENVDIFNRSYGCHDSDDESHFVGVQKVLDAWRDIGQKFADSKWKAEQQVAIRMLFKAMSLKIDAYYRSAQNCGLQYSYLARSAIVDLQDIGNAKHHFGIPSPAWIQWECQVSHELKTSLTSCFAAEAGAAVHLIFGAEDGNYFTVQELLESDIPWLELSWDDAHGRGSKVSNDGDIVRPCNLWYLRSRSNLRKLDQKLFDSSTKKFYSNIRTHIPICKSNNFFERFSSNLVPDFRRGREKIIF